MCEILGVARSSVYYHIKKEQSAKTSKEDELLEKNIIEIFKASKKSYGTRRIKVDLDKEGIVASRRKIARIMKKNDLVSVYNTKGFKASNSKPNDKDIPNILNRNFDDRKELEACVSDLTYVRVGSEWYYICIILDLSNREAIGYAAGPKKDALLVRKAMYSIKYPLDKIEIFHTDRGNEFDNKILDQILEVFGISKSLSEKGCPYDNAVAEAFNKTLKTEFIYQNKFDNLISLETRLAEYIYWYNHKRIHSSLNYLSPVEYRKLN